MATRLIICTDSGKGNQNAVNAAERNSITAHLEGKGWQVWHWLEDLWLVVSPTEEKSIAPSQLRTELNALVGPLKHILVIKVDGHLSYSGMGPSAGWEWMQQNWGRPQ